MQAESIELIKFGILSPEQIKKLSVAKLSVPDTYNEDGYPIDGGLLDQRLGVVDPGLMCKTCGARAKVCPGHFGLIELIRPIVHSEFSKIIYTILQSTCQQCQRILLNEEQISKVEDSIAKLAEMANDDINESEMMGDRAALFKKLKSIKKCPHCGAAQERVKFELPTFFYFGDRRIKPDEIRDHLEKISNDDLRLFGVDPETSRPENLVITSLLVPPVNVRPSITLESGERSEDDLTHKLVDIMRINQRLEQNINAGAPQIIIDDLLELLQYNVTTYFNNETPNIPPARHRSGRALKTLAQRLKGKEGRFRYNLSGKRVNFSARTVISVDPYLDINEVGVPQIIASKMTVPFYVTAWNLDKAKELVSNTEYPMALSVISPDGRRKRIFEANREELLKELKPGDILERQLLNGDIVLFNRQPSLHRISIMAHKVKVAPGKTFRINFCATTPYNADFDGDEMNLHVPQTLEAQAEARYLMAVEDQIFGPNNGGAVINNDHDDISGMNLLTREDVLLTKSEAAYILSCAGIYEFPAHSKNGKFTGRDVFSLLLPKDFSIEIKMKRGSLKISKGKIVDGVLNKQTYARSPLLPKIALEYGNLELMKFMQRVERAVDIFATLQGLTVGVKEYTISDKVANAKDQMISTVYKNVDELIKQYKEGKLEPLIGYTVRQSLEQLILGELAKTSSMANEIVTKNITEDENYAVLIANVGARGSLFNVVQMSLLLGQQATTGGGRIKRGYYSNRVLPHIKPKSITPTERGFVTSSFRTGLAPLDYYLHAMGGRGSEMFKAMLTARSGYLQRRFVNALQDYYAMQDRSVRDVHGNLIQTIYAGDGIDPTKVRLAKLEE